MKVYYNGQSTVPTQAANRAAIFQFKDNRPEAVVQRWQQDIVRNSGQVRQAEIYQGMADGRLNAGQVYQGKADGGRNTGQSYQGKVDNGVKAGHVYEKIADDGRNAGQSYQGMADGGVKAGQVYQKIADDRRNAGPFYQGKVDDGVKAGQVYQGKADGGLPAAQMKAAFGRPVMQLKRSRDVVWQELSAHLNKGGNEQSHEREAPTNLPFPKSFDTNSLVESEKHYDNSFATGESILAAITKGKTQREKQEHFDGRERLLNDHYEDTLRYRVSVPKQEESSSGSEGDDWDFLGGGDIIERRPQATMEDVDVHELEEGQQVKRYVIETGRQTHRGDTNYNNQYDPSTGTFIAAQNFGDKDKKNAGNAPVATNADIIAAQIQAIRRAQWKRKEEDRDKIEIKTLKRQGIINPQTLNTILWSDKSNMKYLLNNYSMKSGGVEQPGSEDFTALLGSPNGRAGGWLFVHYAELLGLDPIREISYDQDNMEIKYGEPEQGGSDGGGDDIWY